MRFILILFSLLFFLSEKGNAQPLPFLQTNNFGVMYQPSIGYIITSQATNFILSRIFFSECSDNKNHDLSFNDSYILDYSVFEYGISSCERINFLNKNKNTVIIPLTGYKNDIINFQKEVENTKTFSADKYINLKK